MHYPIAQAVEQLRMGRALARRWVSPVLSVGRLRAAARHYRGYLADWREYRHMPGAEVLALRDSQPCLYDKTATTPFDPQYFYQDHWALQAICASGAPLHVDVGSHIELVGMLAAFLDVVFLDIRPLAAELDRLRPLAASALALPFPDASLPSLSCLHVAEHIGLGRYGDPLDPEGTRRAARELARVLAPGGRLYFSVPVGRPRVCFNAHRILAPQQVCALFPELELAAFAAVDDRGRFLPAADPADFAEAAYSCGLFQFRRPG